jgi:multiple sugar transport system permease protein
MPGVIWILLFTLFPLIYSLYLSTTNFRMGREPQPVGLQNYADILNGNVGDPHPAAAIMLLALIVGIVWAVVDRIVPPRTSGQDVDADVQHVPSGLLVIPYLLWSAVKAIANTMVPPSTTTTKPLGAIIGRIVGALMVGIFVVAILYILTPAWWADAKASSTAAFSAFLVIGSTTVTLLFGTFVAWVFNHDIPFLRQLRAIITMPLFAAPVAVGFLGVIIFNETNGPINNILQGIGLGRVQWIIDPWGARFAVLITDVWQWTPFVFIIVLAAMQAIPDDLYESARLDTKSNWTLFTQITLPLIAPAMGTVFLLRLVETIKILDIPTTLTRGGPGQITQTYAFYIYETGLRGSFQLGDGSALSYLVVILAIVISTMYFSRVRARFE